MRLRRLVVATHNAKKAREMLQILCGRFPDLDIVTLDEYPNAPEPEETGSTYAENAQIKAEAAAKWTGEWCVADDAGLEIDALGGAPGVHSKRFISESAGFDEKMSAILERMRETPIAERGARFQCCIALAHVGEPTTVIAATCEGQIAYEPRGSGGFGYDPIFYLPELGKTMAELTPEGKHAVSHRGKVLREFGDLLARKFETQ